MKVLFDPPSRPEVDPIGLFGIVFHLVFHNSPISAKSENAANCLGDHPFLVRANDADSDLALKNTYDFPCT